MLRARISEGVFILEARLSLPGLGPILRPLAVWFLDAANFGLHPASPYARGPILWRNRILRGKW